VHGIVHQCGGAISVQSQYGQGTTFKVYIPYCQASYGVTSQRALQLVAKPQRQCILVVEDNHAVREVVVHALRGARYDVIEAASGAEALEKSRTCAQEIELLLSDVVMPNMSGPELAHELARLRPQMRVMLMSGHLGDAAGNVQLDQSHAFRLLAKPFTATELLNAVEEYLSDTQEWPDRVGSAG
jgi:two-component system cell cycle sensor histidine kinase/response regulator CckA